MEPKKAKDTLPLPAAESEGTGSPWEGLEEGGANLAIEDFLTTMMSHASNALRRAITVPYADQAGLTVSEWRMLSVLAEARQLPFMELVARAAADKAQVSRTLRLLEGRGLLSLHAEQQGARKWQTCRISPLGQALFERIIPVARQRQAAVLRQLSTEDRVVLHRALKTLRRIGESSAGL
ncbi:MarR family winged helix-turn-helix transcriptional regulator [Variovorax saccharolyticus]|uniref:MarR family winged helix-turn-helix transcriptional regulator n=1 Tax=Variovorax saccharolyticus TaxID=3053516 RepID=UPI002575B4D6|nr:MULTISPECIES: MarR family winged helix-turn-helix transcriptional regulator [unclassified Variovorax]MDM0019620.1 MarR family winged helix-turn-helix transcriptional regulator [Variovorax sp. J22R187]MDM0027760.1 MarR family winged helix-turn-helix transcriptional regulator [Variovorax sp. J31P216]